MKLSISPAACALPLRKPVTREFTFRWICPHCGHEHDAMSLLRVDGDNAQCRHCNKAFPAINENPHNPAPK